jgi:hypothetical protein
MEGQDPVDEESQDRDNNDRDDKVYEIPSESPKGHRSKLLRE